jgi:hypothetical protein
MSSHGAKKETNRKICIMDLEIVEIAELWDSLANLIFKREKNKQTIGTWHCFKVECWASIDANTLNLLQDLGRKLFSYRWDAASWWKVECGGGGIDRVYCYIVKTASAWPCTISGFLPGPIILICETCSSWISLFSLIKRLETRWQLEHSVGLQAT